MTLDLPYSNYSAQMSFFNLAFARAVAPLLSITALELSVTRVTPWETATVVFFSVVQPTASAAAAVVARASMLDGGQLGGALRCQGLPVASAALGSVLPAPPPPVGSFLVETQGQQLALDIPFRDFQQHAMAYAPAVTTALAPLLGVDPVDISVVTVTPSTMEGTILLLNFASPTIQSDAELGVPMLMLQFASLFGSQSNGLSTLVGDAASPALLAGLQELGLPVGAAFYFDDAPSTSARRLLESEDCPALPHFPSAEQHVTLTLPSAQLMAQSSASNLAFVKAVAPLLGLEATALTVTRMQASRMPPISTTVFFQALLPTQPEAVALPQAVKRMIWTELPLLSALACQGIGADGVYTAMLALSPPPPLALFKGYGVQSQQIAFPVSLSDWQLRAFAWNPAVQAGLGMVLGVPAADVWVASMQPSMSRGAAFGTVLQFDVVTPFSSSDSGVMSLPDGPAQVSMPHLASRFAAHFGAAADGFATTEGQPANAALLRAFQRAGLPVSQAFYYDLP